jgi:hypothetical protein
MKFPLILCHPAPKGWLPAAAAAILIVFAMGCASPGQPHPPSLDLPEVVKDLTAERVGDVVKLHWTTPSMTTDHLPIKGAITAEICRTTVATSPPPSATCNIAARLLVQSGPTDGAEALPPFLTVDPPALLAYRVEILNSHGRSAGPSQEAFVASGAAPPPIEQLRATPARDGAVLEWQPKDPPTAVELDRLPVGPNGVVIEPPLKTTSKSSKSATKMPAAQSSKPAPTESPKPLQLTPPTPVEIKLRSPIQPTDAGGTIDHTVQMGQSYQYTAQRIRIVTLDGHTLELRSAVSLPVTMQMRDIFPPRAPSGLEAAPGGVTAADRSIDLSWSPNTEPDLAGYIVYRQEIDAKGEAAGTAARLNPTPVVGPAYRDQTAVAGHRYAYRVTAVDTAGNESVPSDPVQETLREQ